MPIAEFTTQYLTDDNRHGFRNLKYFVAENPKTLRSFIGKAFSEREQSELEIYRLPDAGDHMEWQALWQDLESAKAVGLVSEAGNPCVADPGYHFVRQAIARQATIFPISGPSSILMALMASGFSGQKFTFHGYLPREAHGLRGALRRIEQDVQKHGTTHVFMETPYRNHKLMDALVATLSNQTMLCAASGLQSSDQRIRTLSIAQWKKIADYQMHKIPTVFCIGI